jgi:FAD/FMN-containing dehydrogenase
VREIVEVPADDAAAIAAIRAALTRARVAKVGVSIAGARHSMGGQTIAPGGIVLDMRRHDRMELLDGGVLRVQSGALWTDVVAYLDPHGRSVAVMQSDSPFSVGGSVSVNCHGWQHLHEPIAATVLAMTVIAPDGAVVRCSRTENASLFAHVLGGYGLFGVILDVDLQTVPNERYGVTHTLCEVDTYEEVFDQRVRGDAGMAYGRISVAPRSFLREAIVTTYEREPGPPPALGKPRTSRIARLVFRGSAGSDYGKNLRWRLERDFAPRLEPKEVSRNQLLSHTTDLYVDRGGDSTDILHEYFVPRTRLSAFVDAIRPLLLREHIDLLNITVRDVKQDRTTALPYAREDVFALVMFFNQKKSPAAEEAMQKLTREMIDKVLAVGGTYYLPYRLHATPEQFHRAYPAAGEFFREKRRVDPDRLFTNQWYLRYSEADSPFF